MPSSRTNPFPFTPELEGQLIGYLSDTFQPGNSALCIKGLLACIGKLIDAQVSLGTFLKYPGFLNRLASWTFSKSTIQDLKDTADSMTQCHCKRSECALLDKRHETELSDAIGPYGLFTVVPTLLFRLLTNIISSPGPRFARALNSTEANSASTDREQLERFRRYLHEDAYSMLRSCAAWQQVANDTAVPQFLTALSNVHPSALMANSSSLMQIVISTVDVLQRYLRESSEQSAMRPYWEEKLHTCAVFINKMLVGGIAPLAESGPMFEPAAEKIYRTMHADVKSIPMHENIFNLSDTGTFADGTMPLLLPVARRAYEVLASPGNVRVGRWAGMQRDFTTYMVRPSLLDLDNVQNTPYTMAYAKILSIRSYPCCFRLGCGKFWEQVGVSNIVPCSQTRHGCFFRYCSVACRDTDAPGHARGLCFLLSSLNRVWPADLTHRTLLELPANFADVTSSCETYLRTEALKPQADFSPNDLAIIMRPLEAFTYMIMPF